MWRLGRRRIPLRLDEGWFGSGLRSVYTAAKVCRAVVLPRFGGPDVLEVRQDVDVPDLKPREVLVRTCAVSINPLDLRMRSGYGRSIFESLLPLIIGRDISGEVAAVGPSVSSLAVGQEVFGALHPTAIRGTYSDYAILAEDELTVKPHSLTHAEASAIPFAALTAWRALNGTSRITKGQRVLVIGGGGAVGLAAIQLSVASGCGVSATCGSQSIERVLSVGAEQAVDYTSNVVRHFQHLIIVPSICFSLIHDNSLSVNPKRMKENLVSERGMRKKRNPFLILLAQIIRYCDIFLVGG